MKANSRARTNDDAEGLVKILADKETDKYVSHKRGFLRWALLSPFCGQFVTLSILQGFGCTHCFSKCRRVNRRERFGS